MGRWPPGATKARSKYRPGQLTTHGRQGQRQHAVRLGWVALKVMPSKPPGKIWQQQGQLAAGGQVSAAALGKSSGQRARKAQRCQRQRTAGRELISIGDRLLGKAQADGPTGERGLRGERQANVTCPLTAVPAEWK